MLKTNVFFKIHSDVHKIKANKIKEYHSIMHMEMYIISEQTLNFIDIIYTFTGTFKKDQ